MSLMARLGFSTSDRALVLHADDLGMCEASVSAFREISAHGLLSSASAMVPCSWFPAVATHCRRFPRSDVGVHLTLTSEWSECRWGPVLGQGVQELCDDAGYFPPQLRDVRDATMLQAAYRELRAQVIRAQRLGVAITHIDSHMFTVMHPPMFSVYTALAQEFRVPCVVLPLGLDAAMKELAPAQREHLAVFDEWAQLPLDDHTQRLETAERILAELPTGLSFLIMHPAMDSPELRAISSDWRARVADYQLCIDERWARALERSGMKVVGMRAIRDALLGPKPGSSAPLA